MLLGFQTPFRLSGYDFRYVDHSIVLQSLRRIQLTSLLPSHCAGIVTKASGDGGIDGIFKEDQLGFSSIYIQAKQWASGSTVGKPEIWKFAGALMGISSCA